MRKLALFVFSLFIGCTLLPTYDELQIQKRALVRVTVDNRPLCSGFWMNNQIYTAGHCIEEEGSYTLFFYGIDGHISHALNPQHKTRHKTQDIGFFDSGGYQHTFQLEKCNLGHFIGDTVYTIGFRQQIPYVFKDWGNISGISDRHYYINNLTVYLGSSGSPLLCRHRKVIGIVVAITGLTLAGQDMVAIAESL